MPRAADTVLARLTAEALAANPAVQAREAAAHAAQSRVGPAGALPDPMLEIGVMNLVLPDFALRRSDFTEVDVQLSQEFPWPGTLAARTRAARAEARAYAADAGARRRAIAVRAAELYYRLRYLVTARKILANQRTLLGTAVEISTARYAATTAPQGDPLQARVALARLDAEGAELAAADAETRAELAALRNVAGAESLGVEAIDPALVAGEPRHPGARVAAAESLADHPRVVALAARTEAAEQRARAERLAARPDFTIAARYGARPVAADFFSAFVGLRLPLWAGRKQLPLAEAARADAAAARAEAAGERLALAAELRRSLALVRSGEDRLRLLTGRIVPTARAAAEAGLRGYRLGRAEFFNVIAAEDSRYRAEMDAARVAAEHLAHLVALEQLLLPREEP